MWLLVFGVLAVAAGALVALLELGDALLDKEGS